MDLFIFEEVGFSVSNVHSLIRRAGERMAEDIVYLISGY
jgi:hypothetical protein